MKKVVDRLCRFATKFSEVGKIVNRGIFTTNKSTTITEILLKFAAIIPTYSDFF